MTKPTVLMEEYTSNFNLRSDLICSEYVFLSMDKDFNFAVLWKSENNY